MDEEQDNTMTEQNNLTTTDQFDYLKRDDFTSENFKIEIKQLPKFYGIAELRKLLNCKLKLNANKIKTPKRNSPYAFVCFRNEEDREKAIIILNEQKWKGKQLKAIKASAIPDPLIMKRIKEKSNKGIGCGEVTILEQEEQLKTSTIPYYNMVYEEQIKIKQEEIKKLLKKLGNDLLHHNKEIITWMDSQKEHFNGLPCELLPIRHAQSCDNYRNKCEFSIGMDEVTKLKTIGFRIGSYDKGTIGVAPIENLKHIPHAMKNVVKIFEKFVRNSKLDIFNPELQTGHFRQLCVRLGMENELMIIVGIHPQNLSPEEIGKFKKDLITFFIEDEDGKKANVASLYYQEIVKKNPGESTTPPHHLWGATHIYEQILGLKFRISPLAFFQVNKNAAEILYRSIIEFADVENNENKTIIDVCCGTGTIALCFSKFCKKVLGLELIPEAITDAKFNAELNGIQNSHFEVGKAEDILGNMCFNADTEELIAIVDPPRAGLHHKAIQQLRKINKVRKIVYVSCNPQAAYKNFVDLGRPESKTLHGEAFFPTKAVAVDMFPHTKHCELVIYFERWDDIKAKN